MKRRYHFFSAAIMVLCGLCILLPLLVLGLWSVAANWPWPELFPQRFSLRAIGELFGGYSGAMEALGTSVLLGSAAGLIAAAVGVMAARAVVFYDFPGKRWVSPAAMLPILLPGTALTMGLHEIFLRLGLADTFAGVVIVHVILAVPYTVKLMIDAATSIGCSYEEAARTLGANGLQAFALVSAPMLRFVCNGIYRLFWRLLQRFADWRGKCAYLYGDDGALFSKR